MNKKSVWLRGLMSAAISGSAGRVVNAFAAVSIAPDEFNFQGRVGLRHVFLLAGTSALLYLVVVGVGVIRRTCLSDWPK